MDHFERIACTLLEREGYWVRQSFKVLLTPKQKAALGKNMFSIPRPEIDLLALSYAREDLVAFEVKSFFDSGGVPYIHITANHPSPQGRYKLFTCAPYRNVVLTQLRDDLIAQKLLPSSWSKPIRMGLIAGNVKKGDAPAIKTYFDRQGWEFWGPDDVKARVTAYAAMGYENDPAVITAKILLR